MASYTVIWRGLLLSGVLLLVLEWPALYNGQPIFFVDTGAYIRGADAGVQAAFHHRSPWSLSGENAIEKEQSDADTPVDTARSVERTSVSSIKDKAVLAGRSPFYGILLYLGEITGGFWLSVGIQALALLISLTLVLRAARLPVWPQLPCIVAVIALGTSAPFYVSFLMPDFFAAIAILGSAVLLGGGDRLDQLDYVGWFALLCAAAIFHDTHVLIIGAMLMIGLAQILYRRSLGNWRAVAVLVSVLAVAAMAQVTFSAVVQRFVGAAPLRPPFLMARLIADGPGYRYLRDTCPSNGFRVCDFVDQLPMSADRFLWPTGTSPGLFASSPPETRSELSAEQYRFVFAVFEYDAWGEIGMMLRHACAQLSMLGLTEFQYDDYSRGLFALKIPPDHLYTMKRSAAYRETMPITLFSDLILVTFLGATMFLIFALTWPGLAGRINPPLRAISGWIIVGVLLNGAICGALSSLHSRYSARVEWLVPLAAVLIAATMLANRRGGPNAVREAMP